jgi:hypothetical protein
VLGETPGGDPVSTAQSLMGRVGMDTIPESMTECVHHRETQSSEEVRDAWRARRLSGGKSI